MSDEEDPDIVELRGLWEDIKTSKQTKKSLFQLKLNMVSQKYTMTELAELLGIKRSLLYYHRGGEDG